MDPNRPQEGYNPYNNPVDPNRPQKGYNPYNNPVDPGKGVTLWNVTGVTLWTL